MAEGIRWDDETAPAGITWDEPAAPAAPAGIVWDEPAAAAPNAIEPQGELGALVAPLDGSAVEPFEPAEVSTPEDLDEVLREILARSEGSDTQRAAGVLALARQTGLPTTTIEPRFDEFRKTYENANRDVKAWKQENAELAGLLLERPELAVVTRDGLSLVSQALNKVLDGFEAIDGDSPSLPYPDVDAGNWILSREEMEAANEAARARFSKVKADRDALRVKQRDQAFIQDDTTRAVEESPFWGRIATPIYRGIEAWNASKISALQTRLMLAPKTGEDETALRAQIHDLQLSSRPRDFNESAAGMVVSDAAAGVVSQAQTYAGRGAGYIAGKVVGAAAARVTRNPAGAQLGNKLGAWIGKVTGAATSMTLETGSAFGELDGAITDDGTKLSREHATGGALLYGAMAAAIEMGSMDVALSKMGPLGQMLRTGEKGAAKQLMADRTFREMARRLGKDWLTLSATEGGEEMLQNAAEQAIGYFSKSAAEGRFQRAEGLGGAIDAETLARAGQAGAAGGAAMGAVTISLGAVSFYREQERLRQQGNIVKALVGQVSNPAVVAAPDAVAELVKRQTAKTGQAVTHVYVDPKAFTVLFQDSKPEAHAAAVELMGEDGPRRLEEALATGQKLEVPVMDYLQKWGAKDVASKLVEDTALQAGDMTPRQQRERDEEIRTEAQRLVKEFESEPETDAPDAELTYEKRLARRLEAQLVEAGQTKEAARNQASVWRAMVRTMAARMSTADRVVDPEEIFQHYDIAVTRGDEHKPGQSPSVAVDALMGALEAVGNPEAIPTVPQSAVTDETPGATPRPQGAAYRVDDVVTFAREDRDDVGVVTEVAEDGSLVVRSHTDQQPMRVPAKAVKSRGANNKDVLAARAARVRDLRNGQKVVFVTPAFGRVDAEINAQVENGDVELWIPSQERIVKVAADDVGAMIDDAPSQPPAAAASSGPDFDPSSFGADEPGSLAAIREAFANMGLEDQRRAYFIDRNTGLLNSRGFANLARPADRPYLAEWELEGGKFTNDVHGHEAFDGALRLMGGVLRANRITDGTKMGGSVRAWVRDEAHAQEIADAMTAAVGNGITVTTAATPGQESLKETFEATGAAHKAHKARLFAEGKIGARKGVPRALMEPSDPAFAYEDGMEGLPLDSPEAKAVFERAKAATTDLARRFNEAPRIEDTPLTPELEEFFDNYVDRNEDPAETIYRDPSGLLTDDGFAAAREGENAQPFVASGDMRGLGDMNNAFGKEGADVIKRSFNETLAENGGAEFDTANTHGDEYAAQSKDSDALEDYFEAARYAASRLVFFAIHADGTGTLQVGIEFAYGIATDFDTADRIELPRRKAEQGKPPGPRRIPVGELRQELEGLWRLGDYRILRLEGRDEGTVSGGAREGEGRTAGASRPEANLLKAFQKYETPRVVADLPADLHVETRVEPRPDKFAVADAREAIARMKLPAKRAAFTAWVDYCAGITEQRPAPLPDITKVVDGEEVTLHPQNQMERDLAVYGIVDPTGFDMDHLGRTMFRSRERGRGGLGANPDGAARAKAQEMRELRTAGQSVSARHKDKGKRTEWEETDDDWLDAKVDRMYQEVFHGSPHRGITQFSLQKIGTGEGAQMYGWGLYFAGKKAIAEWYRKTLTRAHGRGELHLDGKAPLDGIENRALSRISAELDRALANDRDITIAEAWELAAERARSMADKATDAMANEAGLRESDPAAFEALEVMARQRTELAEFLESLDPDRLSKNEGQLYEVDVPENAELLDYDERLTDQPANVIEALDRLSPGFARLAELAKKTDQVERDFTDLKASDEEMISAGNAFEAAWSEARANNPNAISPRLTGAQLYQSLTGLHGSPEAASRALLAVGIPGLTYLDGTSRAQGEGTSNFVIWDDGRIELKKTYYQTVSIRDGKETLKKHGIDASETNKTRDIAIALEKRQREKFGRIDPTDHSAEAEKRIAAWMTQEVLRELRPENREKNGVGWYSTKWDAAIDVFAEKFPELKTDAGARSVFTALVAITSDGQKVFSNFRGAVKFYAEFRETGRIPTETDFGGERNASMRANLRRIGELLDAVGPAGLRDYLLQEGTVKEFQVLAAKKGLTFKSSYTVDTKLPLAAVFFGPKLGAFFANLSGSTGYLTMDRWWSRTFNRYRGELVKRPTKASLDRLRKLLKKPDLTNAQVLREAAKLREKAEAKNFKDTTELEKAGNEVWKNANEKLQDTPFGKKDRTFMVNVARRTQDALRRRGHDLSIADIQAVLWYFEKDLYVALGARDSKRVSYEEAARRVITEGDGDRSDGSNLEDDAPDDDEGSDGSLSSDEDADDFDEDAEPVDEGVVRSAKTLYQDNDSRNLLVQHNLRAEGLMHAAELGGLVVPSLAVSRVEHPLTEFGEITLLAPPGMVDPENGTPTFDADVYSPRWPRPQFEPNYKVVSKLMGWLRPYAKKTDAYIEDLEGEVSRGGAAGVVQSRSIRPALELAWLEEKGVTVEPPMKPADLGHTFLEMPAMAAFFKERGVDVNFEDGGGYHKALTRAAREAAEQLDERLGEDAHYIHGKKEPITIGTSLLADMLDDEGLLVLSDAHKLLRDAPKIGTQEVDKHQFEDMLKARVDELGRDEFTTWATAKMKPAEGKKFFYETTSTGSHRKKPYTPENLLKAMTKRIRQGEGFNYGLGTARAAGAKQFRSLRQVQEARNRIVPSEDFEDVKAGLDAALIDLAKRIDEATGGGGIELETVSDLVASTYKRGGLAKALATLGLDLSHADRARIESFGEQLVKASTEYFEAKPQRIVGLNEFSAAVVPSDVKPEVIETLRAQGITHIEMYDRGNDASRAGAIEAASTAQGLLFQGDNSQPTPRGYTAFAQQGMRRIIRIGLNKNADMSTFLHETGHAFLEIFAEMANRPDAPESIRKDWEKTLAYLGAEPGQPLEREHHEKWARSFEAYLREGKAPAPELVGAFQRFRLWLRHVYLTMMELDVDLNDEIRGVFDRMLATDQEIERAKRSAGLAAPLFRSPAEAGMDPDEWQAYLEEQRQALSHARMQADFRVAKDKLRETERWWKDRLAQLRTEAEAEYEALPVRAVHRFIKGLTLRPDGSVVRESMATSFDRDAVIAAIGAEAAKKFITRKRGGIPPDEVAETFGFATGAEMLQAVSKLPDKKTWTQARAEERMREEHPDILEERGQLRELVQKGIHGDMTAKWLIHEWSLLRKKSGQGGPPVESIRLAAKLIVERRTVGKLDAGGALRSERAAAEAAAKAAAKGDYGQAAVFKQQQLLNMYLHRELTKAREDREKFVDLANSFDDKARGRLGKANPVYRDGVDRILETFGLADPPPVREKPLAGIGEVIAQLETDGASILFDTEVLTGLLANRKSWKDLTVTEMRVVRDALKNLKGVAVAMNSVLLDEKRAEKDHVIAELLNEAEQMPHLGPSASSEDAKSWFRKAKERVANVDGSLLRPETMISWLGGGDISSVWFRAIVQPLQQAKVREVDLLKKTIAPIVEAFARMPANTRDRMRQKVNGHAMFPDHRPDIPVPTRRFEILAMALNAGNEGNLQRLLEGRGITMAQLTAAIDEHLTKEDLEWVQTVWDAMDSLWPESAALEERVTGLRPEKVPARPLVTRHGTFRGGYYPAVYRREDAVGKRQEGETLASLHDQTFTRPGTKHSHLKSRTPGFTAAIALELSTIPAHLTQVAHDIAYREALQSVGSLIISDPIRRVLRERLGEERADVFLQWLKDVGQMRGANALTHAKGLTQLALQLRTNTIVGVLGFSLRTALGDYANLAAAFPGSKFTLKPKHWVAGLKEFLLDHQATVAFAESKSGELRSRRDQIQRELVGELRKITKGGPLASGPLAWIRDHAFVFMEWSDKSTSTPLWMAFYRQGLDDGRTDADAVTYADAMVRKLFPAHSIVDRAAILRDKGFVGASLMFYGYMNTAYNVRRDLLHGVHLAEGAKETVAATAKGLAMAIAFQSAALVLSELFSGRGPEEEEEEDWAEWFLRKLAMAQFQDIPFAGSVASSVEGWWMGKKVNARAAPMVDAANSVGRAIQAVDSDTKDLDEQVLAVFKALGPLVGLPTAAPARAIEYLMDEERPEDEGPLDVAGGLIYGKKR